MATIANLLSGTPTLWIGPFGEALPEIDDLTPPSITISNPAGNWVQLGFTVEDFTLNYEPTFDDIPVNEHLGDIEPVLTREAGTFTFQISENDLTAWEQAINASTLTTQSAAADVTAQDILGVGDGSVTKKALLLVGTSPEGGSRVISLWKTVQGEAVDIGFSKGHTSYEIGNKLYVDVTQAAGERLFKVFDITAAASS